jgi:hypothetical protein
MIVNHTQHSAAPFGSSAERMPKCVVAHVCFAPIWLVECRCYPSLLDLAMLDHGRSVRGQGALDRARRRSRSREDKGVSIFFCIIGE